MTTEPQINAYVHVCEPRIGMGAPAQVTVDSWDYEYQRRCDVCGQPLVTTEQLLAHIYSELTP